MSYFTQVKLIIPFAFILYLTFFSFLENTDASNRYYVPSATSKTSIDLNKIIKKNRIDDNFKELKTDFRGSKIDKDHNNLEEFPAYASVLIEKEKLTNAFLPGIEEDSLQIGQGASEQDSVKNKKGEQLITNSNVDKPNSKSENNKVKGELQKNRDYPGSLITGKMLVRIFLSDNKAQNLKNKLINYGENNVPQYFRNPYFNLVDIFFQYPVVFAFFILILFFIINIFCVLLILNYTIKSKNKKARYEEYYRRIYEEALISYIFGELEWNEVVGKLVKNKKTRNRKILISILLNLHENLKGEVNKFIPKIYNNLELYKDSFKSVRSSFNHIKVKGIRELTYLYPEKAKEIVLDYINYPDDLVRAEAQMAYIILNKNNPFEFLSSLTKPFTRWTQLSAFYLLRLYQLPVPSFSDYLYSKHPTIQNFCLQMITYFQQLENVSEIFNMMNSKVERTRFLSYNAINDLRLYEGRIPIKERYRNETFKNKIEIIKAFKNIGDEEDFQFLEHIIKSESVTLKLEACRSMYFMNKEGCERLIKLGKTFNPEIEKIIAHITDPRN